ncbi:DUF4382 domain-containing protein [Shivajiella indica]|uniref:DUF4382 domain-containing protein n=1 Tax=Shivajiella indica TaxID=872115 RepID=A0ABW5B5I6_9BACT
MKKSLLLTILTLFISFSCTEDNPSNRALVNIFIIGSPGEFDEVWLEILGAEVKTTGTRGSDNASPVFLPNIQGDKRVNVGSLVNTSQYLVGRGEFSEGAVIEMTLKLGNDNFVIVGGERFPLTFASQESSSPTFEVSFPLIGGISHDLFFDFNTFQSIQINQGPEIRLTLDPVLRTFTSLTRGNISGNLLPVGQRATILAVLDDQIKASTETLPSSGNFSLRGLEEDSLYTVFIFPFNESYLQDTLDSIPVSVWQTTPLGNINLRLRE